MLPCLAGCGDWVGCSFKVTPSSMGSGWLGNFVCFFVVKDTTLFRCFHAATHPSSWSCSVKGFTWSKDRANIKKVFCSRPGWDWILSFSRYRTIFLGLTTFLRWRRRITTLSYRHIVPSKEACLICILLLLSFKVLDLAGRKSRDPLTRNIFFFPLQKSWCAAAWLV